MRKIMWFLMVLMILVGVGFCGNVPGTTISNAAGISRGIAAASNEVYVYPGDDVEAVMDAMGAGTSSTDRNTLYMMGGVYTLTDTWELDLEYVDIVAVGDKSVVITKASGITVEQNAADVVIEGITFDNTATSVGGISFLLNVESGNTASVYRHCRFSQSSPLAMWSVAYADLRSSCYAITDFGGTWLYCIFEDTYAFRCDENLTISAIVKYCDFRGDGSVGGDESGAEVAGEYWYCQFADACVGGCGWYGCDVSADMYYCVGGDRCVALGKEYSGYMYSCKWGTNSVAGYGGDSGTNTNYPTFSGTAINVVTDGRGVGPSNVGYGNCFGMGHASATQGGQLINCQNGTGGDFADGFYQSGASTFIADAAASLTADDAAGWGSVFDDSNSRVTFTADEVGTGLGHKIRVKFVSGSGRSDFITPTWTAYDLLVTCQYSDSTAPTGTEIVTALEADGSTAAILDTALADGSDGTGGIADGITLYNTLLGGAGKRLCAGNYPPVPYKITSNTSIYPFDNGATFSNAGATGAVTITLPTTYVGLGYTFIDCDDTATVDLNIDCAGTDNFVKPNGTAMADGEQYQSENDTFAKVTAKCYVAGVWNLENETGTWVEEVPE